LRVLLGGVQKRLDDLREQRRALDTTLTDLEEVQRMAQEALANNFGPRKKITL